MLYERTPTYPRQRCGPLDRARQSDDSAKTWMQLGWKHVKCYSVDIVNKSNGKIIYQACGNGVLRSMDAGLTWKMLTDWRITEVLDIAIDQVDPQNIYIATSLGIWKSMDAGETWFEADTDIPHPTFTSRIKIDIKDHKKIYAATETGIYESLDGSAIWKKVKGSSVATRDMILGSKGVEAWVDDNSGFYLHGTKHSIRTDLQGGFWSIIRKHDRFILSGAIGVLNSKGSLLTDDVKNIHSLAIIGSKLFFGSLNGGVWNKALLDDESSPERCGLDSMQIWRLMTVEIR